MEIKKLTPKDYEKWDNFCLESDDAWFWHTTKWLEYNLNYKPEINPKSKSFIVMNNQKMVAICPLILETHDNIKEFSYGDSYSPIPALANDLTKKQKNKLKKLIFREIDRLAQENDVKRIRLRFSVLNKSFIETKEQKFNYLMKFGYIDNSANTRVIDLTKSIEDIKLDIRHGHDSDIDRASKFLKTEIFNKSNITKKVFEEYVQMHRKAAGRVTRPKSTFDMMHNWIKEGKGFLFGARKDNKFAGFSYFFVFKNNVYYGSSCNEPNETLPVAHLIQWAAIKWMIEKKYRFYELGLQVYLNNLTDFYSKKEVNIGRFKRGFGGFTVPLFIGEKYYDKEYFLEVNKERIKRYAEYFWGGK